MGYYIQVPMHHAKAGQLAHQHGAELLSRAPEFSQVPEDKLVICVVDNGAFEAAAIAYSEAELKAFKYPDGRPKQWLLMDREKVYTLCPALKEDTESGQLAKRGG